MGVLQLVAVSISGLLALAPADIVGQTPRPIEVPASLRARTVRLEPSGIAWSAALNRYLVVSDDLGPEASHHQPALLTMTAEGKLDEAPTPILGLDELDDGESICAAPDNQFFVVTSHSTNHEGVVPPPRRQLLLVRLEGKTLRVAGRADLRDVHDTQGRNILQLAGMPGDARLDIEAIAYRKGTLLIGLKSPLRPDGAAVILRMRDPVDALRRGEITDGTIEVESVVTLTAPNGAPQGIADLLPLADGTLVVVANAPKGGTDDGGGSLYHLKADMPPRRLRWFAGQRPEGLSLTPDGKGLVIVFDEHDRPPLWLRGTMPR